MALGQKIGIMTRFRKECVINSLKHRKNAKRLDKLAELCRGARLPDFVLKYSNDARRARELAKSWELAGFDY